VSLRTKPQAPTRATAPARLCLEILEGRLAPATITVTTTADDITPNDGSVSLREAITAINAGNDLGDPDITAQSPGTFGVNDTINFNVPGAGVKTINVGTDASAAGIPLPTIVNPVTINGYSQPGASVNTMANSDNAVILIELNGAGAGTAVNGLTLGAGSDGSTIKGLAINRFQADASLNGGVGILVQSNGNTIVGNFVGVNPAGTTQMPNGGDGIRIVNASNNLIGTPSAADRNIASGNILDGIHIEGTLTTPATGNLIQGNFVGVAADGKSAVGTRTAPIPNAGALGTASGNFLFGIEISGGNNNTVGGTAAGARNVVGFNGDGIEIDNGGQGNIIQGNFSGVGADGVTPVKNLMHGIVLRSSNTFNAPLGPAQPNEPGVSFNRIGGTAAGAGNLVEFNGTGGIAIFGNPVSASGQPNIGNAIEGNSVFENGRNNPTFLLGIDLTNQFKFPPDDGLTPNDSKGHGAPNDPNNFQNFPVLTAAVPAAGKTDIAGTLTSSPNSTFRIEFFASNPDPAGGIPEGQQFLGFVNVTTDANGNATFNADLNVLVANGRIVTATATDQIGNTSEFSTGLTIPTVPMTSPVALTTPPPFVSVAFGPGREVLLVTFANGTLMRFDANGAHTLFGGVRSASVAFGPAGEVDEIVLQDGRLVQFDATGAHTLGVGATSASIAFGPAGRVLLVTLQNGTLLQFDAAGSHTLASGVGSASVAFHPAGEVIVATLQNGTLIQADSTGARTLGSSVRTAGVGFRSGSEVLEVIFLDGSLVQFDATGRHVLGSVL
jgi:CSLREA domain-containing protein